MLPLTVRAADGTWSGTAGDGQWQSAINWTAVPGATGGGTSNTDIALFDSSPASLSVAVDPTRNLRGVTFDTANVGSYTIDGNTLSVSDGGAIKSTSSVTNTQTINSNLLLQGPSYAFTNDSATSFQSMLFNGAISAAAGTATLSLNGAHAPFVVSGAVGAYNVIGGVVSNGGAASLSLNVTGGGAWALTAANTFTGTTTADGASTYLVLGNDSALGAGKLILQNGAHVQAINSARTVVNDVDLASPATLDGGMPLTINGAFSFTGATTLNNNPGVLLGSGGSTVTLAGTVYLSNTLATPRTVTLNGGAPTVISGPIRDAPLGVGGAVRLVKVGGGPLTLSGASTAFAGGVTLAGGTVWLGDDAALGTGTLILSSGGLFSPNVLRAAGSARSIANPVALGGSVSFDGTQDLTFTGTLTNTAGGDLTPRSTTNSLTLNGPVYLSDSSTIGRTMSIGGAFGTSAGSCTINGVIANFNGAGQSGNLTMSGSGSLTLTANNTFTGTTTVNRGTLTLAAGASLASATVTVAAAGTLNANGALAASATVNANGPVNFAGNSGIVTTERALGALNIGNGITVTVTPSAFAFTPTVLRPAAIGFASGSSRLNLTNNAIITTGTTSQALPLIQGGQVFTTSTGGALGYADAGGGQVQVRFTLLGDTNLDGKVDVTDLGNLASNYGVSSGAIWIAGDSTYDGTVDVSDLGNLASNYGASLAAGSEIGSALQAGEVYGGIVESTAVPEPAMAGIAVVSAVVLLKRRRLRLGRSGTLACEAASGDHFANSHFSAG